LILGNNSVNTFPLQRRKGDVVYAVRPEEFRDENWGKQFSLAVQGRLRKDGAVVEMSSARETVKIEPEHMKPKNFQC
jgi:hypothetical protein